jgi:hypothetical protein
MRIYDCFGCGEKKKEFLKTTGPERKSVPPEPGIRAFSSKVETGSREENASNGRSEPGLDSNQNRNGSGDVSVQAGSRPRFRAVFHTWQY